MASDNSIVCIQCGSEVGDPPQLNRRPDGEPCRVCRDRVLDTLPALLPSRLEETTAELREEGALEEEDEEADWPVTGPRLLPSLDSPPARA